MLKAKELLDIIEIGRMATECDQVDELRRVVVKAVLEPFRIGRSNFFLVRSYPSPRLDLDHIVAEGIEERYIDQYRRHYSPLDPFRKTLFVSPQVVTRGHVISDRDFQKSDYYNEFLRPQSIHHQLIIYLRAGGETLGTLGLCRARDEKAFSRSDIAKGQLLASQLAGALQKAIFMSKVANSSEIINSICPDLPYKGVIVLNESLETVYTNREAEQTISSLTRDASAAVEQALSLPQELYDISENLFQRARKSGTSPDAKVDLKSEDTGQLLSSNLRIINRSQDSQLCLIYLRQGQSKEFLYQQLKKLGLSRRESEVASLICEGFENKQIGEKLFISEYTVQNHLKSIYEKLDVRNRTALARKVMDSSVVK